MITGIRNAAVYSEVLVVNTSLEVVGPVTADRFIRKK